MRISRNMKTSRHFSNYRYRACGFSGYRKHTVKKTADIKGRGGGGGVNFFFSVLCYLLLPDFRKNCVFVLLNLSVSVTKTRPRGL
jgi:hypothetical protein